MRLFLFLMLFNGLSLSLTAQYAIADIPDECLSDANVVIRLREMSIQITGADEAEIEEWIVYSILNKEGAAHAQWLELDDVFTRVKSLKGSLYAADGKVIKESGKQDIKDFGSFSENEFINARVKSLDLSYGQYPYTVEFHIRKTIKGFFRIPDFVVQELGQSVVSSSLSITAPANYAYQWKSINTDVRPDIQEARNGKTSTWKFTKLPAKPSESYNPFFQDEFSKIMIAPMQVSIDGYTGDFSNWNKMGRFFYELNKGRDDLSPEMQATVSQLVAGKSSNREKIDAIYRYLQQNHRYVSIQIGIGGWQTLDALFVEKKKYGDCKALSNYMHTMLKAAGIESYVANIFGSSSGAPEWYDDAPIPYTNHVILYVPGEDMWLECTSNSAPTGYLGEFTAGRKALLLTPTGGKIVLTPLQTASDNTRITHTSIVLDENGAAEVQSTIHATCDQHEQYRDWSSQKKQPDMEKEFVENAGYPIAQLRSLQVKASATLPQASVDYTLKTNNAATRSGKRMFIPVNKFNPFKRSLSSNEHRILDLKLRDTYTLKDTIDLQIPEGYALESLPGAKHIASEFGSFDFQAVQDGNNVHVVRHIEIQPVSVPAARYNEVKQFYQDLTKADGAQVVLVKK